MDSVFYAKYDYDATTPGIATARSGELFKTINTTHAAYIQEVFKGSGLFPKIGETQTVPTASPRVTNKQTILVNDYANSVEVSKNFFDDNQFGVWSRIVEDFALMARVSSDDAAFGIFRGGFTVTTTADGSYLFATHTLIGGGTVVNNGTGALTPDNLWTAIVALRQQKNQAGVVLGNMPAILLVPSQLFKKAIEITQSALLADSADNNLNVYRGVYGIKVMTSPYLDANIGTGTTGSDTAWYLLSNNHSVMRLVRQGIQTAMRDWMYSNNRSYLYQANFRESYFCSDFSGIWASTGTTA